MKKLLFAIFLFTAGLAQAKQFHVELTDEEVKILENDLLDVQEWLEGAIRGKLNKCKERLVNAEIADSLQAGEALPAGEAAIIQKRFSRPDYKNRKQRDLEGRERN